MTLRVRYALVAVVVSIVTAVGINTLVTIKLAERARDASRQSSCEVARTQLAVYRAVPPETPIQREAQDAWRTAYSQWQCDTITPRETP